VSQRIKKTMDGNTAAAYASYPFTEVATIYPITPSSVMAEMIDEWASQGKKNLFGQTVKIREMQSEGGAAGALHGSLQAGAISTTYTASQGLMLMLPNIYKIAGELLPGVFHVSARSLGSNTLSIFGDHQDVMSCRQTGVAQLCSGSVQECYHLGTVAHLSAIQGRMAFMHFFDGFRTSHEYQKIEILSDEDIDSMLDWDAVTAFRNNSINPNHPQFRGNAVNPDIFFQFREATNKFYDALPAVVQENMDKLNAVAGTNYHLFDYYGDPEAENVIVCMGSGCEVAKEALDYWTARGKKIGMVQVRLYRPFSSEHFVAALPKTVKRIAVLDRTKEPGATGEPLYLDVVSAFNKKDVRPLIIGGRYGLASKDYTPMDVMAVFQNLEQAEPMDHFTVGIVDDVTHHSIPVYAEKFDSTPERNFSAKFWGLGADGTVGANKQAVKIIGDNTEYNTQAYFAYDAKKSGGVTQSHLRFGPDPIKGSYQIQDANFIACHNQSYVKKYDLVSTLKDGGTFLLNTVWSDEELEKELPGSLKRTLANKNAKFYTIDAFSAARELGLGSRINMICQAAFFKLSGILPLDQAVDALKTSIKKTYGNKGQNIVDMNCAAVDRGISMIHEVTIPESWKTAADEPEKDTGAPDYYKNILGVMGRQKGDTLPVSAFNDHEDGSWYGAISKWEKRGIAIDVPAWKAEKCIECNQCSFVCPHAVIRPILLDEAEAAGAPEGMEMKEAKGFAGLKYHLAISGLDCTGCGVCVKACPVNALEMEYFEPRQEQNSAEWQYTDNHVTWKEIDEKQKYTVKGSQFLKPYLEFNGACGGCAETPYIKLVTQLYGDHMMISNSAGCSHIWGGSPEVPWTTNTKGQGPAWGCSLFEDTAEFGYGMMLGNSAQRSRLKLVAERVLPTLAEGELKDAMAAWLEGFNVHEHTRDRADRLAEALKTADLSNPDLAELDRRSDYLVRASQWVTCGDGCAYDIDYGGLDQVLASGENINVFVMDTEVYSNTGGQSSKATPAAAIAKFAASGKRNKKKDLGAMAMTYGYVYVAQVAMGADKNQTLKAIREAESYDGPSLIIGYCPCINHGLKAGMSESQNQQKRAVECGYWHMYRFDPRRKEEGLNPFQLDSKEPAADMKEFMLSEVRYASLAKKYPAEADQLFEKAKNDAKERLDYYKMMASSYQA